MRVFVYEYLSTGAMAGQPGAASLAREGLAMLAAAAADLAACPGVEVVTMAAPEIAPALSGATVHAVEPGQEEPLFRRLAGGSKWTLVIAPEFDNLLARRVGWAKEEGSLHLNSTPSATALTGDKLLLAQYLRQRGVPTPETVAYEPGPCPFDFPVVVKPRYGAGAQATFRIDGQDEFDAAGERAVADGWTGELIVQPEWAPERSVPASVSLLIGPGRRVALMPGRQGVEVSRGQFRYASGRLPLEAHLRQTAHDLAARATSHFPGLRGYVGVDLVVSRTDGVVIEINPRLTTSYVGLRRLARFNVMQAMLDVVDGRPTGPLEYSPGEVVFLPDGSFPNEAGA